MLERIKPITMDVDELAVDHDAEEERKAQYLIQHLVAHGQRLCLLAAGADGKEAHGLSAPWATEPKNDCFDPGKPYWRNMIRRHVKGEEAQLHVRFKAKPNELVVEYTTSLRLGMYFGGWSDVGNNKVANFGIDCDRSREHQLLIDADKNVNAETFESRWKADPVEVEAERKRLVSMMEVAMKRFPNAAFFCKPNGKWHAHGNLSTSMDANEVKLRVIAMLPEEWKIDGKPFIEVFPKSPVAGPLKEYSLGNQMRLPFGASGYQPLDPTLPPIKPTELAELPQEEPKIEMEMKPVQQVVLKADNGDVVVDGVTYPVEELRSRAFKYICGDNFPFSKSGSGSGDNTLFYASNVLRGGFYLSESDALDILRQYNDIKCKPKWPEDRLIHKIKEFDPTKLGKHKDGTPKKMGWLLTSKNEPDEKQAGHIAPPENDLDRLQAQAEQDEKEAEEEALSKNTLPPMPKGPSSKELEYLIKGTPLEVMVRQCREVIPDINILMPIGACVGVAGAYLSNHIGIKTPNGKHYIPNVYVMLSSDTTSGKGTSSSCAKEALFLLGIPSIPEASDKRLILELGKKPWGLLHISEMHEYLNKEGYKKNALDTIKKMNGDPEVTSCGVTTGDAIVAGQAPSMIAELQPSMLMDNPSKTLIKDGWFNRCTVIHDDKIPPRSCIIGELTENPIPDGKPVADAIRSHYGIMTKRIPAPEEYEVIGHDKDGEEKKKGLGRWNHPAPTRFLRKEKYTSVLQQFEVVIDAKGNVIRNLQKTMAVVASLFETRENLDAGVITVEAQRKADVLFLAIYWSTYKFYEGMPGHVDEMGWRKIDRHVRSQPGHKILLSLLRKQVYVGRSTRQWNEAFDQGLVIGRYKVVQEKNKQGRKIAYVEAIGSGDGSVRENHFSRTSLPIYPPPIKEVILKNGGGSGETGEILDLQEKGEKETSVVGGYRGSAPNRKKDDLTIPTSLDLRSAQTSPEPSPVSPEPKSEEIADMTEEQYQDACHPIKEAMQLMTKEQTDLMKLFVAELKASSKNHTRRANIERLRKAMEWARAGIVSNPENADF